MASSRRIGGLDALKGVAIAAVVAIHALSTVRYDTASGERVGAVVNGLLLFAVPTFMAISMMLLTRELRRSPARDAIVRRIYRLVPVYLVWTAFYVAFAHLIGGPFLEQLRGRPVYEVVALGGAAFHLYFLPALLQLVLLAPLIVAAVRRPVGAWAWLVGGTAVLALGPHDGGWPTVTDLLTIHWALVWLPVAGAGIAIALGALEVRRPMVWVLAGAVALAVESIVALERAASPESVYARAALPLVVVGLLTSAIRWHRPAVALTALGRRSLGVFLVHPVPLLLYRKTTDFEPYDLATGAVVAVMCLAVSGLFTAVVARTPMASLVDGFGRRRVHHPQRTHAPASAS